MTGDGTLIFKRIYRSIYTIRVWYDARGTKNKKKALPGQLHLFSRRGDNIKTFTEAIVDRASGVSPPLSERAERKNEKLKL